MYPTYCLEWLWRGAWARIAWEAYTPPSRDALEQHGRAMADADPNGRYRLVVLSHLVDGSPTVVKEF